MDGGRERNRQTHQVEFLSRCLENLSLAVNESGPNKKINVSDSIISNEILLSKLMQIPLFCKPGCLSFLLMVEKRRKSDVTVIFHCHLSGTLAKVNCQRISENELQVF